MKRRTPEADLEKLVCTFLATLGYTVLKTTHRVKRCECGRWSRGDYGSTPGVPDVLARPSGAWKGPLWIGLELKAPGGKLSPAQKVLADAGAVTVIRSLDDLMELLRWIDPERVKGVSL